MKAIEKRTGVQRDRRREITRCDRHLELARIARDDDRIERERRGADDDFFRPQLASQRIDCLLERMTRAFVVTFRPEIKQQLVTAEPGWAGGGKEGQK